MTETLQHPEARRRVTAARTGLVLDEPFFGMLALRLKLVEEPDCSCPDLKTCPHTAWTDGESLGYWPRFIMSLKLPEVTSLIIHEVMHCANGHPWRRDSRDPRRANEAMDRAINPVIREAGYTLPPDALYELEPSHHGKSFEWIYDRLPKPEPQKDPGQGSGSESGSGSPTPGSSVAGQKGPGDSKTPPPPPGSSMAGQKGPGSSTPAPGGSLGEVRDAPTACADPAETPPSEADWQQAVQQAAVLAKGQGKLPGSLKRFAKAATDSRIDWRSAMRRFAQETCRADYSFARPNPRYVAGGLYLPSLRNHEVGILAVGVDVSGSVDQVLLDQFASEIRTIADEVRPRQIHVLYCDSRIQAEEIFERDDTVVLKAVGGGGTNFCPVFDHIAGWDEPPVAVIYLTDLLGTFPKEEPAVPTLWVTGNEEPRAVPFGEVVTAA